MPEPACLPTLTTGQALAAGMQAPRSMQRDLHAPHAPARKCTHSRSQLPTRRMNQRRTFSWPRRRTLPLYPPPLPLPPAVLHTAFSASGGRNAAL
jgi:hypothetical protein